MDNWGANGPGTILGAYAAILNTSCTVNEAWVQKVKPTRIRKSVELEAVVGTGGPGETANIAAAITLRSDFARRSGATTKKIGPTVTSGVFLVDGKWETGYLSLLGTLADTLLIEPTFSAGATVFSPCVPHPKAAQAPWGTQVRDAILGDTIRVNRRRTVGLGI